MLLSSVEIKPDKPAVGSVIWLHGLGADGHDFVSIVPELGLPADLPLRFIFPHAPLMPVTINNGYVMRAWYDIVALDAAGHADQAGIETSVNQVRLLIEQEKKLGIPSEKIILAGFSQGAVIALTTGLTHAERLGGIMALSGYLPHTDQVIKNVSETNRTIPIFLAHGTEDPVVPFLLGEMTSEFLKKHQYPLEWHPYPMQHSVCWEEIRDAGKWLTKSFGK